ncbi:TPA: ISNCY family transposase, partial [Bacillus thuringiensis]|nr:ISNCY family transposase [Bacillus thuringiensis]
LFTFADSLTIGDVPPVTGRPPICRKALLKCFFLKTVFQINSLRKLTRFLHRYPWLREERNSLIHKQILHEMNLELIIPCVLIDST